MSRIHGPYQHGDRWRLAYRDPGSVRLRYRSFSTKEEAERVAAEETEMQDDDALALLSAPIALPRDPVWIYLLLDDADDIVYVGMTRNLFKRYYDHRENAVPFHQMMFFPEPFDRSVGLRVEAALIRKHNPPLNRAGLETRLETDCYEPRVWSRPEPIS